MTSKLTHCVRFEDFHILCKPSTVSIVFHGWHHGYEFTVSHLWNSNDIKVIVDSVEKSPAFSKDELVNMVRLFFHTKIYPVILQKGKIILEVLAQNKKDDDAAVATADELYSLFKQGSLFITCNYIERKSYQAVDAMDMSIFCTRSCTSLVKLHDQVGISGTYNLPHKLPKQLPDF